MKNIRVLFFSENFQFLEVKFSIYLNRRVFVMLHKALGGLSRIQSVFGAFVGRACSLVGNAVPRLTC